MGKHCPSPLVPLSLSPLYVVVEERDDAFGRAARIFVAALVNPLAVVRVVAAAALPAEAWGRGVLARALFDPAILGMVRPVRLGGREYSMSTGRSPFARRRRPRSPRMSGVRCITSVNDSASFGIFCGKRSAGV